MAVKAQNKLMELEDRVQNPRFIEKYRQYTGNRNLNVVRETERGKQTKYYLKTINSKGHSIILMCGTMRDVEVYILALEKIVDDLKQNND